MGGLPPELLLQWACVALLILQNYEYKIVISGENEIIIMYSCCRVCVLFVLIVSFHLCCETFSHIKTSVDSPGFLLISSKTYAVPYGVLHSNVVYSVL